MHLQISIPIFISLRFPRLLFQSSHLPIPDGSWLCLGHGAAAIPSFGGLQHGIGLPFPTAVLSMASSASAPAKQDLPSLQLQGSIFPALSLGGHCGGMSLKPACSRRLHMRNAWEDRKLPGDLHDAMSSSRLIFASSAWI
jgi:hypothetical protein